MTNKKTFFEERTAAEIARLNVGIQRFGRGLVESILGLNDTTEGIAITGRIIPDRFYAGGLSSAEAARKAYKHGSYLSLWQPETRTNALNWRTNPQYSIGAALEMLSQKPEEEIFYIGDSFRPVQGTDRRKRAVPFAWQFEGPKLFAYAETMASGIDIKSYDQALRVGREGASVVCEVPSRTKGEGKYLLRLGHVPVRNTPESPAIIWGLESTFSAAPMHSVFNIRYTYGDWSEGSGVHTFYPHDIAAYLAVAKAYSQGKGVKQSMTPLRDNPFIVPSRLAVDFYNKICNNVLVDDRDGKKEKIRKLYVAEKCILLGRMMGVLGKSLALHTPQDGSLNNYDWGNRNTEMAAIA